MVWFEGFTHRIPLRLTLTEAAGESRPLRFFDRSCRISVMGLLSSSIMEWATSAQDEEEEEIAEVREFHEGRQFDLSVGSPSIGPITKFISARVKALLERYPICNIAATSVEALTDRLRVTSLVPEDAAPTPLSIAAGKWWKKSEWRSWQKDLYKYALRDKAAVVIVGYDDIMQRPTFSVNEMWDGVSDSGVRLFHDGNGKLSCVAKRWLETDEFGMPTEVVRLTLYFEDRLERWISERGAIWRMLRPEELGGEPNPKFMFLSDGKPVGLIAVPFYNADYVSEVRNVILPQTLLNENVLSWYSTGRYHGFPLIGIEGNVELEKDDSGKEIPPTWGPGRFFETGGAPFRRVEAADVEMVFKGIVLPAIRLAAIAKRWPMHIFTSELPESGEVIRGVEGPFVKHVESIQDSFANGYEQMFRIAANVTQFATGQVLEGEMEPVWAPAETNSESYRADVVKKKSEAAEIPNTQRLRELGYSDKQIKEMTAELDSEKDKAMARALADTVGPTDNSGGDNGNDTGNGKDAGKSAKS